MDLREKIEAKLAEIKKVVFEEETTEKDFVDAKTATGDILKVEPAIEVGAQVMVITEDGEEVPAPDGSYELEDGSVIAVEAGIIANVEALEAPAEEEMAAEPVEETVEEPKAPFDLEALQGQIIDKLNVAITEKIEKLRFAKEETVEELKAQNDKLKEGFEKALEVIEELSNAEAVQPETKTEKKFTRKNRQRITIKELTNLIK
jgi:hypothetical protein